MIHENQDRGSDRRPAPSAPISPESGDDHTHPGSPGGGVTPGSSNSTENTARSREQLLLTNKAIQEAGLGIPAVWLRYFSFSGAVAEYEVHAYLQGLINLPRLQRDLIAQAVNELIDERPFPRRAPSDADLEDRTPDP